MDILSILTMNRLRMTASLLGCVTWSDVISVPYNFKLQSCILVDLKLRVLKLFVMDILLTTMQAKNA